MQAHRILRRGNGFHAALCLVQIGHDLITADDQHDRTRPVAKCGNAIAVSVHAVHLAMLGNRVGRAQIHVRVKALYENPLKLFRRKTRLMAIQEPILPISQQRKYIALLQRA